VASFPAGSECLLLLLDARVASVVAIFARAAVGFIFSLRVRVGVSRRLREPVCGVAFTSAGLWFAEPVEGVLALLAIPFVLGCVLVGCPLLVGVCPCWMSPCCWGVCCWLCVWPCMPVCHWALCSAHSTSLLELSRCFVCRVALLVECCDTWLLRCIAWLPCVLVRFPRIVGCCPGKVRSQDCSGHVSAGCCATSRLRYAAVVLAVAFWWVFPEWRLGGFGGGSPRTNLCCFRCVLCALCWP
ncbi:hypothetical protein Taro_055755, partial [Colocasia esculenta]|nr:hypothetical protein [Colocasia esculenta]